MVSDRVGGGHSESVFREGKWRRSIKNPSDRRSCGLESPVTKTRY